MRRLTATAAAAAMLAAATIAAAPPAEAANCTTPTRIANVSAHGSGQTVKKVNKRLHAKQRLWTSSGVMKVYRVRVCHTRRTYVYVTYRSGRIDAHWPGWILLT